MDEISFRGIFKLAIPIVIQNFIFASLQIVDSFMIAGVGEKSLAAVTISSQIYFFVFMMTFGMSSGASVFISQYFGAKNYKGIRQTLVLNITFTTLVSFIVFVVSYFFASDLVALFTNDTEVLRLGVRYLKITSFSYVLIAVLFPFELALRSINLVKTTMFITTISVVINTLLNYVLIYGRLGISPMGVDGAALGTLIARMVEFFIIVYIIYIRNKEISIRFNDFKSLRLDFVSKVFKVAFPVLLNEMMWGLGTILYLFVFAKYGSKVVVGYQISYQFYIMIESLMIGFALASQVMIGNAIGEKNYKKSVQLSRYFIKIIIVIGVLATLIMLLISDSFISFFNLSSETSRIAKIIITVIAIFNIPRFISILFIIGIARGGGDTKFALYLEVLTMWLINFPIIYLAVVLYKVDVLVAILLIHIEDIIKSIVGYHRYRTKKWINNVIE